MTPRDKNKVLAKPLNAWSNRHYQFDLDQEAKELFTEYTQQLIGAHKFGGITACESKTKAIFEEMQQIVLSDTSWVEAPDTLDQFRYKLDCVYAGYIMKLEDFIISNLNQLHQAHQLKEIKTAFQNYIAIILIGIPSKITRSKEVEDAYTKITNNEEIKDAYINNDIRHAEEEYNEPKPNFGRNK